jgi:transient receptor potential cation channel subfamily C member 4
MLGTLIEAAKSGSVSRFIGRSRSEDSVCNSPNNRESASHSNSPNSDEAVTESPTDSNPSLDKPEIDHKHHHHHQSSHNPPSGDPQRSNNSNVHSPQSISNKKEHHHMHLNFGALAALKRKRKKFSNSRNESPVLDPPPDHTSFKKSIKKVINRNFNTFITKA